MFRRFDIDLEILRPSLIGNEQINLGRFKKTNILISEKMPAPLHQKSNMSSRHYPHIPQLIYCNSLFILESLFFAKIQRCNYSRDTTFAIIIYSSLFYARICFHRWQQEHHSGFSVDKKVTLHMHKYMFLNQSINAVFS